MPRRRITHELDSEIRRLGGLGKTCTQIAKQLNLKFQTVNNYLQSNNIERGRDWMRKPPSSDKRLVRRKQVREGFFNEHERENWLV